MTLLITLIAAVVCTVIWYKNAPEDKMQVSTLCFIYWGAALMWLADAVSEYIETEAEFFSPSAYDMLNDAFLGISAVALGLVIWIVKLLITDPKHIFRKK
ncbi:MAG TPA: hypothetical protein DIW26_02225 [Ruminococcus sp.]|nr:hypothetical protein [Ruminococcus sp.]